MGHKEEWWLDAPNRVTTLGENWLVPGDVVITEEYSKEINPGGKPLKENMFIINRKGHLARFLNEEDNVTSFKVGQRFTRVFHVIIKT